LFKQNWAKTISIDDDTVFCAGGSLEYSSSNEVYLVNVKTGFVTQMPNMSKPRQGHGIALVCGFVYCCAGFDRALMYNGELDTCERFSLINREWK
jgi:hypothetical protein